MKRIIEHGYKYHMETRCPSCGCLFTYDWEDVLKESIYTYKCSSIYTSPSYQITCPECGAQFQLLQWKFTGYRDSIQFTTFTKEDK